MNRTSPLIQRLEQRRRDLGMSHAVVANRSGVSLPTVRRILSGTQHNASLANVLAIADALGLTPSLHEDLDALEYREKEAEVKARRLVRMVQGSSGLEGQAVDQATFERMVRQTVHELLAGSRRKLWAT